MGLKRTPPNTERQLHHGLSGIANSSTTLQGSPIEDVFQVPPWPHPHQLQLPAKTNKQQTWLEDDQRLQLRHPLLPDTVQADIVLPENYIRLEQSASGDRGD